MPIRKRLQAAPVVAVDAVSAFKWSDTGDGLSHALGYPCFSTRAAAERAWQRVRREVWAKTHRFNVPDTATIFDGVTTSGVRFIRSDWNLLGAFDLAGALAALAVDRGHLATFERTKAARSIADYLDVFRADLDTVERIANQLASVPTDQIRPYPSSLNTSATYGGHGFEQKPIDAITKADVEAVRTWRRQELAAGKSRPGAKGGEVGINRLLSRLRHVFSWAIAEGHITDTPFKRGPVTVVKLESSVEGARTRRLDAGTQNALLRHADGHLRAVLVAALSTGCRIGELLSLQWAQIRRDDKGEARYLLLTAAKTKTAESRTIPIGPRLRAELEMRRHAPDGQEHPATAYVFGNAVGEQARNIRQQWEDAVLKAHGHTPTRRRGKLTGPAQAAYQAIDLHVHDLRREFACSLLESGAALHDARARLAQDGSRGRIRTRFAQFGIGGPARGAETDGRNRV